ncbi:MAG: C1 family peptidase [Bacteroidales bacterium]|nr:C1 family peptidase [Bacteroidales bacterium]
MNIKSALILGLAFLSFNVAAQENISTEMLKKMQESYQSNPSSKALENAVSSNSIKNLAVNRENLGKVDTYYSNRVKTKGVTNQHKSGRCWLFTGLNVLRPVVINKLNIDGFEFSQAYLFFYDQLEKSNLFMEGIIATADKPMDDRKVDWFFSNPIGDGGQWTGLVDLVQKYGAVPSTVMPESYNANNTSMLSKLLRRKLRENGLELRAMAAIGKKEAALRLRKEEMLSDIYKILALSLGQPPAEFQWRYKKSDGSISELKIYTPQSFYKEFVAVELTDYIMFMNDPTREYYKLYEIEYDRHRMDGQNWKYINLPIEEIKEFAKASILDNEAMYFSCDVGKQLDGARGYLDVNNYDYGTLLGVEFGMDKKQRIATHESGSSHGMTLVAVDVNNDGTINKWLLENSWGMKGYKGHLIMTDEWFTEYMFRLVVNKKYVDAKTLEILNQKPLLLPPWDPMFTPEP